MIYTVTFNPAIDYVVQLEHLTQGTVNRTGDEAVYCGGKGINVSTVLTNLGIENVALGFLAGFTATTLFWRAVFPRVCRAISMRRLWPRCRKRRCASQWMPRGIFC